MSASQKRRLIAWLCIVAFGAVAGYAYTAQAYSNAAEIAVNPWRGVRAGILISGVTGGFEIFAMRTVFGAWLRRLPLAAGFSLHLALATLLVVGCLYLNIALSEASFENIATVYTPEDLLDDTLFSLAAMTVALLALEVTRYIGARNLLRLVTGRYNQPLREDRIFAIMDVAGSTDSAARLGDERFHAYLSSVFFDIDQPIVDHGGEIHSYVGDAVFIAWPSRPGERRTDVLQAVGAVLLALSRRGQHYRREFGIEPRLRIAIHCGNVIAGQCGDSKRQITYLGEALNVTARIEALAKVLGHDILVSAAARERLELPPGFAETDAGGHELKGVAKTTHVFALNIADTRAPSG